MKRLFLICTVFFLATSVVLFNGCDKVNDVLSLPTMSAKVNNDSWTSLVHTAVMYVSNNYISIIGTPTVSQNADKVINISVNKRVEGTYELNVGTLKNECLIVYIKNAGAASGSSDYYASTSAIVTVTKVDAANKTLSGTFSATLVESSHTTNAQISITEGKFENLPYTEIQ